MRKAFRILLVVLLWVSIFSERNAFGESMKRMPGENFEGAWNSDFGVVDLTHDGSVVTGSYSCCKGKIHGKVEGNTIEFVWQDPLYGEGWGKFTLDGTGKRFTGMWGRKGDSSPHGQWNGERYEPQTVQQKGVRTQWRFFETTIAGGVAEGTSTLFFDGHKISGTLEGSVRMEIVGKTMSIPLHNTLDGSEADNVLNLKWRNPYDGSQGDMILKRENDALKGRWKTLDGVDEGEITFTRVSEKEPVPGGNESDPVAQARKAAKFHDADDAMKRGMNMLGSSRYDEALVLFKQASAVFREMGDLQKLSMCLVGIGDVYNQTGQYELARKHFLEVLDLKEKADPVAVTSARTGILIVAQHLKMPIDPTILGIVDPGYSGNTRIELSAEANRAIGERRYNDALRKLYDVLAIHEKEAAPEPDSALHLSRLTDLAITHGKIATVHTLLDQVDAAVEHTKREMEFHQRIMNLQGNKIDVTSNLFSAKMRLGDLHLRKRNVALAQETYLEAVADAKRYGTPDIWRAYHSLAKLYGTEGKTDSSVAMFEDAIKAIETTRSSLVTDETKRGFLEQKLDVYFDYIALLVSAPVRDGVLKALMISERMRTATVELLAAGHKTQIVRYGGIQEVLSPEVARSMAPADLLKDLRRTGSVYIAFLVAADKTHVWTVEPSGRVEYRAIPVQRKEIQSLVEAYLGDLPEGMEDDAAARLYDLLIKPAEEVVARYGTPVVFVPHDLLNLVPLHALSAEWMLKRDTLYVPSLSLAAALPAFRPEATDSLLIVADPDGSLPGARIEADIVRSAFSGKKEAIIGAQATAERVRKSLGRHSSFYIAAHGKVDAADYKRSFLRMADGGINVSDIYETKMAPKIVVLSSCETHKGRAGRDELLALSRPFVVKGASYVLVTLWEVEDRASQRIVSAFFKNISAGIAPPRAIREALAEYYRQAVGKDARPYFWAPFILIGNGESHG